MSSNKMLIDASHPEETRVALVKGNRVEEFDFESEHKDQIRGNIYLAKVTRVEPSLQAAFVDYGGNRHGFLAFSEIHPDYYQIPVADRQALIEAEEEAARNAAAEDDDDGSDDSSQEADASAEEEVKPARKRRSRRRSKKSTASEEEAGEENSVSSEEAQSDDAPSEESNPEEVAAADDASSPVEASTDADAAVEVAEATEAPSEEDDDDENTIAAENDGDDVVSEPAPEPAPKPRRRTSRKKIEPEATAEAVEADGSAEKVEAKAEEADSTSAEEPAKKPRRRTSRKKKEPEVSQEAEATSSDDAQAEAPATKAGEAAEDAQKPKRRRTSRKKKEPEAANEENATDVEAVSESPAPDAGADEASQEVSEGEAQDKNETDDDETNGGNKRGRSRRSRGGRSRGRKRRSDTDGNDDDNSSDTDENVEEVGSNDAMEDIPPRRINHRNYKIQEVIKRRQILLVQVVKEERGNKGAALTTYLSLAGRYSVLMPNTARGGGISRKITNVADRKRLKAVASSFDVPQGMGVILRTAGASRAEEEIQRDFEYLMRLWENVRTLTLESTAPCLVYEEGSLIKRSIRDLYHKDTGEVMVSGEAGFKEAQDFMAMLMPDHAKRVKLYKDRVPLFARMGVEAQLDAMLQPQVTLKSGGYLILDQTEALVAIDVNSGRSTRQHSVEETAVQTNLEAADEVARQLRLRDLAGLIVIDFIDMEDRRNVRAVEKRLKDALKNDRARIQVGRISHFGLMEMSRQRMRASVLESTTQVCPVCEGLGHVRSSSSVGLAILRAIEEHLNRNSRNNLTVKMSTDSALYLLNNKKETLSELEERFGVTVAIATDDRMGNTPFTIEKGELSNRKPKVEAAIQPDTFAGDIDSAADEPTGGDSQSQPEASDENPDGEGRKKRRRRRRRRGGASAESNEDAQANAQAEASPYGDVAADDEAAPEADSSATAADVTSEEDGEKRVRKTRRTSRKKAPTKEAVAEESAGETPPTPQPAETVEEAEREEKPVKPKRTRRKKAEPKAQEEEAPPVAEEQAAVEEDQADAKPKRRTTRRKKPEDVVAEAEAETAAPAAEAPAEETVKEDPPKKGWWNRKFF